MHLDASLQRSRCTQKFAVLAEGFARTLVHGCGDRGDRLHKGEGGAQGGDLSAPWLAWHVFSPNVEASPAFLLTVEDGSLLGMDGEAVLGQANLELCEGPLQVLSVVAPQVGVIHEGPPGVRRVGPSPFSGRCNEVQEPHPGLSL